MTEKKTEEKTRFKETTIGELGSSLAIGTSGKGSDKLDKRIVFDEMTTADEKVIGKKTKKGATMGDTVSIVLAQMVRRLGEYDLSSADFSERLVQINRLYMGDVLLAFILLRIETMGEHIDMEMACQCSPKKSFSMKVDLRTTKVRCIDDEDAMVWHYKLLKPRTLREKLVESLSMTSPRWSSMCELNGALPPRVAAIEGLRSGVIGFNEEKNASFIFTAAEFDQIGKRDLENIIAQVDEHVVGPQMAVEAVCPTCERDLKYPINWQYSDFFAASSPSQTSRR